MEDVIVQGMHWVLRLLVIYFVLSSMLITQKNV